MMRALDSEKTRRWAVTVLLALATVSLAARFVKLEADFPVELTDSGALYTDEGWYLNSAVRLHLGASWHLPGDVNEALVLPVFHGIEWLSFSLLGMNLTTARLPGVLIFCGLTAILYAFLHREVDPLAAALAAAMMATNFCLFAYSRVALVELPMLFFVVLSAFLLVRSPGSRGYTTAVVSGIVCALAIMTKTTAVFAVPPLLALAAVTASRPKDRLVKGLLFAAGVLGPMATLLSYALHYPDDLISFRTGMGEAVEPSLLPYLFNVYRALRDSRHPSIDVFVATLASLLFLVLLSRRTIRNRAVWFLVACGVLYLGMLTTTVAWPTRYFMPLLPIGIAIAASIGSLLLTGGRRAAAAVIFGICAVSILLNAFLTVRYLMNADYSYRSACMAIKAELAGSDDPLLMGNPAPQISLVTGIPAISAELGAAGVDWKIEHYDPTHFVSVGPLPPPVLSDLQKRYRLDLLHRYDVFGNYYAGPVHLYRLTEHAQESKRTAESETPQ